MASYADVGTLPPWESAQSPAPPNSGHRALPRFDTHLRSRAEPARLMTATLAQIDLARDFMAQADAADGEHHFRRQFFVALEAAARDRIAHRFLDLALRSDADLLEEATQAAVEAIFIHDGAPKSRFARVVEHVFAEIALRAVGARFGLGAHGVALLAADDIGRRARLDIVGAAIGVVIGGAVDHDRLAALEAASEHGGDEQECEMGAHFRPLVRGRHCRNCADNPSKRWQAPSNHTLPFSASPISSSTLGSSIVAGMVQLSPSAIFLMVPRRIFPERVFGSRPTVIASLKAATGPSLSRTSATTSFSTSAGAFATPAFSTRKPQGTSPLIASLMPSTAHSATSEWEARISSMPPVDSRWPATLMMSSVRPITQT